MSAQLDVMRLRLWENNESFVVWWTGAVGSFMFFFYLMQDHWFSEMMTVFCIVLRFLYTLKLTAARRKVRYGS